MRLFFSSIGLKSVLIVCVISCIYLFVFLLPEITTTTRLRSVAQTTLARTSLLQSIHQSFFELAHLKSSQSNAALQSQRLLLGSKETHQQAKNLLASCDVAKKLPFGVIKNRKQIENSLFPTITAVCQNHRLLLPQQEELIRKLANAQNEDEKQTILSDNKTIELLTHEANVIYQYLALEKEIHALLVK